MTEDPPKLQVFVPFPSNPNRTKWDWIDCLAFPHDTLEELQFLAKPCKWIRYATGVVVGAEGDLSFNRDSPNDVMDYEDDLRSESADLYYHMSVDERQRMFPVDPDMGHTHVTSGPEPQNDHFRNQVAARDQNRCILTGYTSPLSCDAAHLVPHAKGDEYIETYTRHRSRDPAQNDVVHAIDDIRNGVYLNKVAYIHLGESFAFLVTPNFAITTRDVDPNAEPTEPRCTAHIFNLNVPESLGNPALHSGSPVRMPHPDKMNQWPPDILLDAIYGNVVLRHFATQRIHDMLQSWKSTLYPGVRSAAQASQHASMNDREGKKKREIEQHNACSERAAKRARAAKDDGFDNFDLLMMLPYLFIPRDEQEVAWRRQTEEEAEKERRGLEERVGDWAQEVADACSEEP